MTGRKTIQHTRNSSWSSPVIESKVIGERVMEFGHGLTLTWYKIDDSRANSGWVSVPMRLHLNKETNFFNEGGVDRLERCVECYQRYMANPDRGQFTDITPEEEVAASALVMALEMGFGR